ncbi:MAG: hypothetical protein WD768_17745, partial [Phycisphaeraceae bacterium]
FSLPPRTSDGLPELVRYEWSGNPGDPLIRTINGTATPLLEKVNTFAFTWDTAGVTETHPGPPVEGAEQLLVGYYPSSYNQGISDVSSSNSPGQYFNPTLPADAVSWRITKVRARARRNGLAYGTLHIRLRKPDGANKPTSTIIDAASESEANLSSSFQSTYVTFDNAGGISPASGVCVVFEDGGVGDAAQIEFTNGSGSGMLTGTQGNHNISSSNSLRYEVYGKISTPGTKSVQRTVITGVQVSATTTVEPTNQITTATALMNRPEVLSAFWELNFSHNPTGIDTNADATYDWSSNLPFNQNYLSGGKWVAAQTITTNSAHSFASFTTIETRMADTTTAGNGASMTFYVDRKALTCGVLETTLRNLSNGTQQLKLGSRSDLLVPTTLATLNNLPLGNLQINYYVNPASQSVICAINGQYQGTYQYNIVTLVANGSISLFPESSETGATFDHVRIRAGGTPQ